MTESLLHHHPVWVQMPYARKDYHSQYLCMMLVPVVQHIDWDSSWTCTSVLSFQYGNCTVCLNSPWSTQQWMLLWLQHMHVFVHTWTWLRIEFKLSSTSSSWSMYAWTNVLVMPHCGGFRFCWLFGGYWFIHTVNSKNHIIWTIGLCVGAQFIRISRL